MAVNDKQGGNTHGPVHAGFSNSNNAAPAETQTSSYNTAINEQGHHGAGSRRCEAAGPNHQSNPRQHGGIVESAARPDCTERGRRAEPDSCTDRSRDGHSGVSAEAGGTAGANGDAARTYIQDLAAKTRLESSLKQFPDAMARLRAAAQNLNPDVQARHRLDADGARISKILATRPEISADDMNPAKRATAYAGEISDNIRARAAASQTAQAKALAAVSGRSAGTRIAALFGFRTAEQRRVDALIEKALELTDAAECLPTRDDYRQARAHGERDALAAQNTMAVWRANPDVARVLDDERLSVAAHTTAHDGDKQVYAALQAGDPEGAREIIRCREHEDERQRSILFNPLITSFLALHDSYVVSQEQSYPRPSSGPRV